VKYGMQDAFPSRCCGVNMPTQVCFVLMNESSFMCGLYGCASAVALSFSSVLSISITHVVNHEHGDDDDNDDDAVDGYRWSGWKGRAARDRWQEKGGGSNPCRGIGAQRTMLGRGHDYGAVAVLP
jgi:hypothetical protein